MTYAPSHRPASKSLPAALAGALAAALGLARIAIRRRAERRALEDLMVRPDHQLTDIGLDRDQVRRALAEPFWQGRH